VDGRLFVFQIMQSASQGQTEHRPIRYGFASIALSLQLFPKNRSFYTFV
jgi:hypothetical protein